MTLAAELQKFGLSDKEAKVYLATLELGRGTAQNIAIKSGVNRGTTYSILETLIEKGLCREREQNKMAFYTAAEPDDIYLMFDLEKKQLIRKEQLLEKILPQLKAVNNSHADKPEIRFYEGKRGIFDCRADLVSSLEGEDRELLIARDRDLFDKVFSGEEQKQYAKILSSKKIKVKELYNYSAGKAKGARSGSRVEVTAGEYKLADEMSLFGNIIQLSCFRKKPSAVLIKDKGLAETLGALFNMAWETGLRRFIERKKKEQEHK